MATENKNTNNTGFVTSVNKFVKNWINMITGKGKLEEQSPVTSPQNIQNQQEDSVQQDIKKAKSYLSKWFSLFAQKSKPTLESGKESTQKAVDKAKEVVDVSFTRKLLKIFFTGIAFLIFLAIAMRLLNLNSKDNKEDPSVIQNIPSSPTLPPYNPIRPSIYAEDKVIGAIEEDARVLINEILGRNIRDDSLQFPSIDMNISL